MDRLFGIEISEYQKIVHLLNKYDISIDELIECFDCERFKNIRIKKIYRDISILNNELTELEERNV